MFGKTNCVTVADFVDMDNYYTKEEVNEKVKGEGVYEFNLANTTWYENSDYEGEFKYYHQFLLLSLDETHPDAYHSCIVVFDEISAASGIFSPVCELEYKSTGSTELGNKWHLTLFAKRAPLSGKIQVTVSK